MGGDEVIRKILLWSILLIVLLTTSVLPRLLTYSADSFNAYGTRESKGWYWCESKDSYLEWYWFPLKNLSKTFYVNFHLKMSNKVDNGGSGFSSEKMVALLLIGEDGEKILRRSVFVLYNPFPIKFEGDSEGLGQDVYGSVEFQVDEKELQALRNEGFRIRLVWPPLDNKNVFAASIDVSPVLSFVEGGDNR